MGTSSALAAKRREEKNFQTTENSASERATETINRKQQIFFCLNRKTSLETLDLTK